MNHNLRKLHRSRARGQGLVEYAIIIALVALVSIVILGFVGLAVNKNYGFLCAVLGCREDSLGQYVLAIDRSISENYTTPIAPLCAYFKNGDYTLFYATLYSNIPPSNISVDTDRGERFTPTSFDGRFGGHDCRFVSGDPACPAGPVVTGAQIYQVSWNESGDHRDKCPAAVVAQSDPQHGHVTIMAPVTVRCYDPAGPDGFFCG